MRRVLGLHILFALALLPVNVAGQAAKPAQLPNPALTQCQVKPTVSAEVSPKPATVNRPAQIRAIPTPANGVWEFEFYMNSSRLDCAIDSPVCDWTPKVPGEHSLIVLARFGVASRGGGRGGTTTQSVRAVLAFGVEPEPAPTPTLTPTAAAPELAVRLLSDKVIAQQPARFEVSLTNAPSPEYFVNLGDGVFIRRTDPVFDHAFQQDGLVTIVVRYAGVDPPLERSLTVNVEPRPQSPLNTPAPGTTPAVTDQRTDGEIGAGAARDLWWPYALAGAVIVGALIVARAISKNGDKVQPPDLPLPPPIPTFHPQLKLLPHFEPARTGGVSLVVIYVHNLEHLRFSSTQTNRSEG